MKTEKEKILRRIREALSIGAPYPGAHDGAGQTQDGAQAHATPHTAPSQGPFSQWLPHVGGGFESLAALFAKNSVSLKTAFHLLENETAAGEALREIARAEGWKNVGAHGDGAQAASTRALVAALDLPITWTDAPYDVRALERCEGGITECDALIAQTGSVLVTSRSAGGRALSVLPPHHVVLARRAQLMADLPAAFEALAERYREGYPSFVGFITGPSRTGDIERILVLGAHGPKRLTVLCW